MNKWRENHRRDGVRERSAEALPSDLAAPANTVDLDEAEYRQRLIGRVLQVMRADFQPATWKAFWECVACDRSAADVAAELGLTVKAVYLAKARVLRSAPPGVGRPSGLI